MAVKVTELAGKTKFTNGEIEVELATQKYSRITLSWSERIFSNKLPSQRLVLTYASGGVLHKYERCGFWLIDEVVYFSEDKDLTLEDVIALVNQKSNQRRLQLEKAHALQAMVKEISESKRRSPIPQPVKLEVWQRDSGRCVECGSQEKLEFDHVIPVAMGGSNTSRNIQLLCETCNRRKGASLG